ncbi:unnamed protein product [Xylocopa violacea]
MRKKYRARYGFDGEEIPIREDIQQTIQNVMDDLNVSERFRNTITFFNVHDVDIYHAGYTLTKFGAIIGIPVNFEYQKVESITDQTISLQYVSIDWSTEPAKQFRESLVLSENAKKFAIAWGILSVTSLSYPNIISYTPDVFLGYALYYLYFRKCDFAKYSKTVFLSTICVLTIYTLLTVTDVILARGRTKSFNKQLTALGSDYIDGGAEYYEKLTKRNKALRILLGERGKYWFQSNGDKVTWFLNENRPISKQLRYFNAKKHIMQV